MATDLPIRGMHGDASANLESPDRVAVDVQPPDACDSGGKPPPQNLVVQPVPPEMPSASTEPTAVSTPALIPEPPPLEGKVRDLLLTEAKERYKQEIDRNGQIYTRTGVYLGILAVYVNAVLKLFDNPPPRAETTAYFLFLAFAAILLLSVLVSFLFVVRALLPTEAGYAIRPSKWIGYVPELRNFHATQLEPNANSELEEKIESDLRQMILDKFSEAVDFNFEKNNLRSKRIFYAGWSVASGFGALIITLSMYTYLLSSAPVLPKITSIRVTEPVNILSPIERCPNPSRSAGQPPETRMAPSDSGQIAPPIPTATTGPAAVPSVEVRHGQDASTASTGAERRLHQESPATTPRPLPATRQANPPPNIEQQHTRRTTKDRR